MKTGIPVSLGYLAVSFTLGITAKRAGLTALQAACTSLLVNASAGEYAAFTLIAAQASYLELAIMELVANARYLLMSCALSQKLDHKTGLGHRMAIGFAVTDELFGLSILEPEKLNPMFYYGMMACVMPGWALGTFLGVVMGSVLPASVVSALSVGLYGMFLAVIIPQSRKSRTILIVVVLSMAVSELNHMVDQWRASYGNPGDVSALSYGYKVITLLTGVIIVPLTTIMFSRMSRLVAENDRRGILQIVRRSTVTIAMVMTPIIAICAVGNQDVIKALYLSGEFDLQSAAVTAGVFLFYVIGVLGFGLRDLLNRTFHAMQDTRTTMYVSAGIVVANVILNSIFHALMGVRGLALATTISGTGGMLVLFYLLRRRLRRLGMKRIVPDMAKIFLASGLTALAAWGVGSLMPAAESRMFAILRMLAMGGAGLGVYLLAALALGVTPLKEFIGRKGNANDGRRTADHHGVSRGGRAGGRVAAPADADRVLRAGKTEKKPERVHAGRHRPPRAAGSSAAIRPARAGQDDAGRHHRRGDGAQHTHHQRPRH